MGTPSITDVLAIVPDLLWPVFALAALLVFRNDLQALLSNVIWRVRAGASLKVASFELRTLFLRKQKRFLFVLNGVMQTEAVSNPALGMN